MSVTSIQFIGLFVVMMNSGAGLHILLPHFPGTPFENHVSVIQYDPNQVSSASWPGITSCGPNDSLRCAPIDLETITFSGATDPAPVDVIGSISHLRCCCAPMTDILPKYKDPAATGKLSAHIFLEKGIAEAITNGNSRTDTWITMHSTDTAGITLIGNTGSSSFNIVFKPAAQFQVLNSTVSTSTTPPHFLAYYLMGSGSSSCTSLPADGPPCAPRATECVLPRKQSTKAAARRRVALKRPVKVSPLEVDSECSNSHWP
ncbi:MAG TPA: hypothetical protein VHY33_12185 [Thermoanaerobaculia bacterium]|jgi:hypothetical protein|nr:hypothetical protein [Thermoanaerobaculia bacterium]